MRAGERSSAPKYRRSTAPDSVTSRSDSLSADYEKARLCRPARFGIYKRAPFSLLSRWRSSSDRLTNRGRSSMGTGLRRFNSPRRSFRIPARCRFTGLWTVRVCGRFQRDEAFQGLSVKN
jgi:hypothetical protein